MTHEPSWEQLAEKLERLKVMEPLRAQWCAYEGSEDYGIWLLRPDGERTAQIRATFTLIAAHIIENLELQPIPVPHSVQHCPHWADYCSVEEDMARRVGQKLDLSDAVPFGLDTIDRDAVDPCTRAFLEVLRCEGLAFQVKTNGTSLVKGQTYSSVSGSIEDLFGAAAAYCKRRARDEIGARLRSRLENVGAAPSSVDGGSGHTAGSVLDPFQEDAGTQPLGDNPFPTGHPAYKAFEEATWKAKEALNGLRSELLETLSKPPFDFIQSILTFRVREVSAYANAALLIVGNEETAERYERWLEDFARFVLNDTLKKGQVKAPQEDPESPPLFTPELLPRITADLSIQLMRIVAHYKKEAANRVLQVMVLRGPKLTRGEETAPGNTLSSAGVQPSPQDTEPAPVANSAMPDEPLALLDEHAQAYTERDNGDAVAETVDALAVKPAPLIDTRSPIANLQPSTDEKRTPTMVLFGSSVPVTIVRAAGTPEERIWNTRMGGDFVKSALFQPEDRVVTGDELYSDLFDEPRVVVRVDPVLGSGQVAYWKATITPRSAWNRLCRNNMPPQGRPLARNVPSSANATRSDVSTDTDPKVLGSFDEVRDQNNSEIDNSAESHAVGVSSLNFTSEAGRNKAVLDYTKHWTTEELICSEASLARSANVDPADLSKWKKALLPAESDKKRRIEKAIRDNQRPTRAPKKPLDE
jgi:hypothetical protein